MSETEPIWTKKGAWLCKEVIGLQDDGETYCARGRYWEHMQCQELFHHQGTGATLRAELVERKPYTPVNRVNMYREVRIYAFYDVTNYPHDPIRNMKEVLYVGPSVALPEQLADVPYDLVQHVQNRAAKWEMWDHDTMIRRKSPALKVV